jgi:uncharacterized membrane protein YgcG
MSYCESGSESSKMRATGTEWLMRVLVATSVIALVSLFASTGRAMAAEAVGDVESATHTIAVFGLVWLLSSLRVRKKRGRWRLGFEPSPVRRVRASSTVHRAGVRGGGGVSGGAGASGRF